MYVISPETISDIKTQKTGRIFVFKVCELVCAFEFCNNYIRPADTISWLTEFSSQNIFVLKNLMNRLKPGRQ